MSIPTTPALEYHAHPRPGKISVEPSKPCTTQHELALAYTPGVAEPVRAIAADPEAAYRYTAKGNLVGVITDGTAVLGLGNVGALAGKPVMEGKAVLFKRFAGIDVFDIEVKTNTPEDFINAVVAIAPTFGAINLEDIAAPACFLIEQALSAQLDIPVMHDDQHGTAVVIAASLLNALELQGKSLATARIVALGAGAAGIASLNLLVDLGAKREHILVVDRGGVIHKGRDNLNRWKQAFAADTAKRTLAEALRDADVLLGVSGPNLVSAEMVRAMAPKPVILALSNPDPEIMPEVALAARPDAIMGCGRSDYPNQVNNVLGFPYIFRGALDVRARTVNRPMLVAAAQAIAALARQPVPREVLAAYKLDALAFGPQYILPKPLDVRLMDVVPAAVARAAVASGVARAPYPPHYPA